MTEQGEQSKPWHWPGRWLRDETFWNDVASRTLAILFAGAIAAALAIGGGYIARPDVRGLLKSVGWLIAILTVIVLIRASFRLSLGQPVGKWGLGPVADRVQRSVVWAMRPLTHPKSRREFQVARAAILILILAYFAALGWGLWSIFKT